MIVPRDAGELGDIDEDLGGTFGAVQDLSWGGAVEHGLLDILVIAVWAVMACAERWHDIAFYGTAFEIARALALAMCLHRVSLLTGRMFQSKMRWLEVRLDASGDGGLARNQHRARLMPCNGSDL